MKLIKDILSIFNMAVGDSSLADKVAELNVQRKEVLALKIKVTDLERELLYAKKRMAGLTAKSDIADEALEESNRTIEALEIALEMTKVEDNADLKQYITDLELEQKRTLELIEQYSEEMKKV